MFAPHAVDIAVIISSLIAPPCFTSVCHSTTFFSSSSQVVHWSAEIQTKVNSRSLSQSSSPGGVLKKVLYGEAPPRGPTAYPFIYHFFRKGTLFVYLLLETAPLSYTFLRRLMNKSLKQEVFLTFFLRSA